MDWKMKVSWRTEGRNDTVDDTPMGVKCIHMKKDRGKSCLSSKTATRSTKGVDGGIVWHTQHGNVAACRVYKSAACMNKSDLLHPPSINAVSCVEFPWNCARQRP